MGLPRGYGSVSKSGNRWRASVRIDGRNRYIGTFDTEEIAEAEVLKARNGKREAPTDQTLKQWGMTWMHRRQHDGVHRCWKDEQLIWRTRIAGTKIESMQLADITTGHVRDWVRELMQSRKKKWAASEETDDLGRSGYSRCTLVNALNCLRVCLRDAVLEDLIPANPARELRIPRMPRTDEPWTWLRLDEIDRLIGSYRPSHERNIVTFAVYSGMRAGEIFGLRWSDVDLENDVVTVRYSFDGPTKSGRVRRVPLLAPAKAALLAQKEELRKPRRVKVDTSLVFPGKATRMRKHGYNAQLHRHLKAAGITRRVRFHDLRHTFASHLVQGSWGRTWTLQEAAEMLGHSSVGLTARYAHLCEGGIARAARETTSFAAE
jgi:integrase